MASLQGWNRWVNSDLMPISHAIKKNIKDLTLKGQEPTIMDSLALVAVLLSNVNAWKIKFLIGLNFTGENVTGG